MIRAPTKRTLCCPLVASFHQPRPAKTTWSTTRISGPSRNPKWGGRNDLALMMNSCLLLLLWLSSEDVFSSQRWNFKNLLWEQVAAAHCFFMFSVHTHFILGFVCNKCSTSPPPTFCTNAKSKFVFLLTLTVSPRWGFLQLQATHRGIHVVMLFHAAAVELKVQTQIGQFAPVPNEPIVGGYLRGGKKNRSWLSVAACIVYTSTFVVFVSSFIVLDCLLNTMTWQSSGAFFSFKVCFVKPQISLDFI